jgi:DNA-binding IclR family transcriptional regulator
VLSCLHREPDATLRDVAARVGITERAAHRIVGELEEAGYLEHQRVGRRNLYSVRRELPLRHQLDRHRSVGDLLDLIDEAVDH